MGSTLSPLGARGRLIVLILAPLLAVIALVSWGYSSPVGSSPDDDFHLASIWCGGGYAAGKCEPGDQPGERRVDQDLVVGSVCAATQPDRSAACQGDRFGVPPQKMVSTSRGNFSGQYPPVFYFVMSLFAGSNIDVSVLLMRAFNSLLFVGLVTGLWHALPQRRRINLVAAIVVSIVPLGMFLIPSTNPSGWAILSAATLWISLVGWFETRGRRRVVLGVLSFVAAVVGAGARSDAAVFVGIAAIVAVILTFRRDRAYALESILPVALVIMAVIFYATSGQSSVVASGFGGPQSHLSPLNLVVANVLQVQDLWPGLFGDGSWGLGWLDTPMPAIVWVSGFAVFISTVFVGLTGPARKRFAVAFAFASFLLIPIAIMVQSKNVIGTLLQPRYILPLAIILVGACLFGLRRRITRPQWLVALGALTVANAVALEFNIRRYVTGNDVVSIDLDAHREWWWPGLVVLPNGVWVIGSLAFAGLMVIGAIAMWRRTASSTDRRLRRVLSNPSAQDPTRPSEGGQVSS